MKNNHTVQAKPAGRSYWALLILFALFAAAALLLSQFTVIRILIPAVMLMAVYLLKRTITRQKRRFQILYWIAVIGIFSTAFLLARPAAHDISLGGAGKNAFTSPVQTEYGQIEGVYNSTKTVREFAGIPYAKPPVGNLRWKAPQTPTSWKGVRVCDHFSDCEVQSNLPTPVSRLLYFSMGNNVLSHSSIRDDEKTSEDCLYLNVWTAAKSETERRPVIVYIHGGSFTTGSGSIDTYNGESMAKKGAVFVTINYRLGIFGFYANPELSKESSNHTSGNYGILDQIAALKWVKENIAAFGGDPDNVTVAGESAGSMSVSILQASPLAKGLFERVIAESGGYFGSQGFKHGSMESLASAEKEGVNLEHSLNETSVAELRNLSSADLLKISKTVSARPILDGYVLKDTVYNTFDTGKENEVPALIGNNANESTLWTSLPWPVSLSPDYSPMNSTDFHQIVEKTYGNYANLFFRLYPTANQAETVKSERDSDTEQWFAWHMHTWAELQSRETDSKVYYYYFNKVQPGPAGVQALGAYHSSEIAYAYGNLNKINLPYTNTDYQLSDLMSSYWLNFARSGNPNASGLPDWEPYQVNTDQVMELGDTVKMIPVPNKEALNFFDQYESSLRSSDR